MTFKDAARFTFPFGKHKGKTLDQIAQLDGGLTYLDWALGLDNLYENTKNALTAYLGDPAIKRELQTALDAKKQGRVAAQTSESDAGFSRECPNCGHQF